MLIIDIIKAEKITAMKRKDVFVKTILTTLIGEIEIVGKNDGNRKTTDTEAIKVITKFNKGVIEMLDLLQERGAVYEELQDLLAESKIYEAYLPTLMTEDELRDDIKALIFNVENPNIGSVMKALKENSAGTYDGKMASKLIKELL